MICKHDSYDVNEKIFSNGTIHLEKTCSACGKHLGYVPQNNPLSKDFKMPFGKHKGKTINEIALEDYSYLTWASENLKGNLRKKISLAVELLPSEESL